jgi:alpha-tubulin suppressor-like RCC1 family protein
MKRSPSNSLALAAAGALAAGLISCGGDGGTTQPPDGGLTFVAVTAGSSNTCGLTPAGTAYCWGASQADELGDGRNKQQLTPEPLAGSVSFASVSVDGNGCGVTVAGAAYCWGGNLAGELGIGTNTGPESCLLSTGFPVPCSTVPVPVAGGLSFSSVSVGSSHRCGITAAGAAYCWGHNYYGQLGVGTTTGPETCPRSDLPNEIVPCSTVPVPVVGGMTFASVSAAETHTCGVTTAGAAYCWGSGTLGDGTTAFTPTPSPVLVAGGLSFASVSASRSHTCGITTAGAAYCWGDNVLGQLGNGTYGQGQSSPVPVAGGLSFASVSAGDHYTCGVTVAGAAYCWGNGGQGQLGNGIPDHQSTPVPVAGGLRFASVSAGASHTCGITTAGVAYCWGANESGQLGDGTTTQRLTPVLVAGG